MTHKLVEIGSWFDWISPLLAIAGDLAHGGGHTFLVPHGCGWSGRQVARLLKKHGIESWGLMVVSGTITVTVRPAQARWAQYVLDQVGVPLEGGRIESRHAATHRSSAGIESDSQGMGSALGDMWNAILF